MKTIKANKIEMSYLEVGSPLGLPVILIHAFPFNHLMWREQFKIPSLQYRLITYDLRGFGRTELGDAVSSLDLYCDDLLAFMDTLNIKKAVLCGLSMGGYIALRAKELYPQRITALLLADTRTEADSVEAKEKRMQTIEKIKNGGIQEFVDAFLAGALSPETVKTNQKLVMELKEFILTNSTEGICAALRALAARSDTSLALTESPVPTAIIVGEFDKITPLASASKMSEQHGDAKVHVISAAGHLSNLENPIEFNKALLSFLSDL